MNTAIRYVSRCIIVIALLFSPAIHAVPTQIVINTSSLNGVLSTLAFDLIDGGPPANTVVISGFANNGAVGASSSVGDVTGAFPGNVRLGDGSFFNEYLQHVTLGTALMFTLDVSANAAGPGSFPDAFSFFLLNAAGTASLVSTSDPTGANSLLFFSFSQGNALAVYTSTAVTIAATPLQNAVREPRVLWLFLGGLLGLGVVLSMKKSSSGYADWPLFRLARSSSR